VVQVGLLPVVRTDGNGYFVVTLIPATGSGTTYDVTATSGADSTTLSGVQVTAGDIGRADIVLSQ